jgi:excisionase family DNA binding protein
MFEGEEMLTTREAAQLYRTTDQTVRNWIAQGTLPAVRVGRQYLIPRSMVEAQVENVAARDERGKRRHAWDRQRSTLRDPAPPAAEQEDPGSIWKARIELGES